MSDFLNEEVHHDEEQPAWLATFADMSLLLLIFFILLFSLSTLDPTKFEKSFGSIKGAMGGDHKSSPTMRGEDGAGKLYDDAKLRKELVEAQKQNFNDIRSFLVEQGVEGQIGAVLDEGVITLRLPANVLFEQFNENILPENKKVLDVLADIFVKKRDQHIDIRGYTDNVEPPEGMRFKDNWELSALRAVTVLRYLLSKGIESTRLTATGFADLNPLLPNTSEENRGRNRRVEFVLEKTVSNEGR